MPFAHPKLATALEDIATVLGDRYGGADVKDDVSELLDGIGERGLVVDADG